jgi:hypothetical protein
MVNYNCPRCGYNTQNKPNIVRHMNRKNICKPKINDFDILKYKDEIISGKEFSKCEKCNEIILDKNHNCEKKDKDSELAKMKKMVEQLNEKLDKQVNIIDKQGNKIDELLKNPGTTNIINNNTMNIMILSHKDTDVSHLKDIDYYNSIGRCIMSVPNLIKRIHFDKNRPENHNIYIKNKRNEYIMVYDGGKWIVKDQTEVVDDLIRENEYRLEDWIDEGSKKYPKAMKKFKLYMSKRDEKGVPEKVRNEVKMMLYNNRDMIQEIKD